MYVIRLLGYATKPLWAEEDARPGEYLKFYDPDGDGGAGTIVTSPNIDEAIKYTSAIEAGRARNLISTILPVRLDGKPNRPLSAWHIEILTEEYAQENKAQ